MALWKRIPTWGKLSGAVGIALLLVLIYEWRKSNEGVEGDPCDPDSPSFDKELCERMSSVNTTEYPPKQSGQIPGSGGGGGGWVGIQPYLPAGAPGSAT